MQIVLQLFRLGRTNAIFFAGALLILGPLDAGAADLQFVGNVGYVLNGKLAWVTSDGYANYGPNGESGPIRIELWAFPAQYPAPLQSGYKMAQYALPTLGSGWKTTDVNPSPVPFASPPNGTW